MENIFDKVLFVGPDLNGRGGIASVLRSYSHCVAPFHYMRSNSAKGSLFGIIALIMLLLRLPYFRWVKGMEIVHIHGASGKSFVRKSLIVKLARVLGYKVIFHSHGGLFNDYVKKTGREKVGGILTQCDAIAVLSNNWKEYFEQTFDIKNVYVINNIVFPPTENVGEIKISHREPYILLFLGLICDNKGIFDLLDVIALHKTEFDGKIRLIVGGNGEVERLMFFVSQNQLENIVEYRGWISGDEKTMLLKECDIVVLPSYIEGVPISLLEAMANAKPSITTNVGGIPGIIESGKNGVIIIPGDKNALYNAIRLYIDNPQLITEYGIEGFNRVEYFYPKSVMKQLENLYNRL